MQAVEQLSPTTGTAPTCAALGVARATLYRHRSRSRAVPAPTPVERSSARALDAGERQAVLAAYTASASSTVAGRRSTRRCSTKGTYLCSERTMYRLLESRAKCASGATSCAIPPTPSPSCWPSAQPGVVVGHNEAPRAGQVDLLLPLRDARHLQPLRRRAGWSRTARVGGAGRSSSSPRARRSRRSSRAADRARRSRLVDDVQAGSVAARRPRRHQDPLPAPRLERQPVLRGAVQDAEVPARLPGPVRQHRGCARLLRGFFDWYNNRHYHSGLALLTPATVHHGDTAAVIQRRGEVLAAAYAAHPERFVRRAPRPAEPPTAVWINPPKPAEDNGDRQ